MPKYRYGFNARMCDDEIAKAQQYNIDASYKDLCAVCSNLKGLTAEEGVTYLEAVLEGFPVLYKRWNTKLGHRRELGGKKGRYPVKSAKYVLMVLRNAIANASSKGLDGLSIVHVSANKQAIYPRMQSKGRQMKANYETARVEIVLSGKKSEKVAATQKEKAEKKVKSKEAAAEIQGKVEKATKEAVKEVKEKSEAKPAEKKETKPAEKSEKKEEKK